MSRRTRRGSARDEDEDVDDLLQRTEEEEEGGADDEDEPPTSGAEEEEEAEDVQSADTGAKPKRGRGRPRKTDTAGKAGQRKVPASRKKPIDAQQEIVAAFPNDKVAQADFMKRAMRTALRARENEGPTTTWRNTVATVSDLFFDVLRTYTIQNERRDPKDKVDATALYDAAMDCLQAVGVAGAGTDDNSMQMNNIIFRTMREEVDKLIQDEFGGSKRKFLKHINALRKFDQPDSKVKDIREHVTIAIPKPRDFVKAVDSMLAERTGRPSRRGAAARAELEEVEVKRGADIGDFGVEAVLDLEQARRVLVENERRQLITTLPAEQRLQQELNLERQLERDRIRNADRANLLADIRIEADIVDLEQWTGARGTKAQLLARLARENSDEQLRALLQSLLEQRRNTPEQIEERRRLLARERAARQRSAAASAGEEEAESEFGGVGFEQREELLPIEFVGAGEPVGGDEFNIAPTPLITEPPPQEPPQPEFGTTEPSPLEGLLPPDTMQIFDDFVSDFAPVIEDIQQEQRQHDETNAEIDREAEQQADAIAAFGEETTLREEIRQLGAELLETMTLEQILAGLNGRYRARNIDELAMAPDDLNATKRLALQLVAIKRIAEQEAQEAEHQANLERLSAESVEALRDRLYRALANVPPARLNELFPQYAGRWKQWRKLSRLPTTLDEIGEMLLVLQNEAAPVVYEAAEREAGAREPSGALACGDPQEVLEYLRNDPNQRVLLQLIETVQRRCGAQRNDGGQEVAFGIDNVAARYLMDHQERYLYPQVLYSQMAEIIAMRRTPEYKDQLISQLWHYGVSMLRADNVLSATTIDAYNFLRGDVSAPLRAALRAYEQDNVENIDQLVAAVRALVGSTADAEDPSHGVVPQSTVGAAALQIAQDVEQVSRTFNAASKDYEFLRVFYPALGSRYRLYPLNAEVAVPNRKFSAADYSEMMRNNLRSQIQAMTYRLGFLIVKGTGEPYSYLREQFVNNGVNGWSNVCHQRDLPQRTDVTPVLDAYEYNSQVLAGFGRPVSASEARLLAEFQSSEAQGTNINALVLKLQYVYERLFMAYPGCFMCFSERAPGVDQRFSENPNARFTAKAAGEPYDTDVAADDVIVVRVQRDTLIVRTNQVLLRGAYALKRTIFLTLTLTAPRNEPGADSLDDVPVRTRTIAIRSHLCDNQRPIYQEAVYSAPNWQGSSAVLLRNQYAGNANLFFAAFRDDVWPNDGRPAVTPTRSRITPSTLLGFWVGAFTGDAYIEEPLPDIRYNNNNVGMLTGCGIQRSAEPIAAKLLLQPYDDEHDRIVLISGDRRMPPADDEIYNGLTVEYLCAATAREGEQPRMPLPIGPPTDTPVGLRGVGFYLMAYALAYYSKYDPKTLFLPVRHFVPEPVAVPGAGEPLSQAQTLADNQYAEASVAFFYFKHFGLQFAPAAVNENEVDSVDAVRATTEYELGVLYLRNQYPDLFQGRRDFDALMLIPDFRAYRNLMAEVKAADNTLLLDDITRNSTNALVCRFYVPNYYYEPSASRKEALNQRMTSLGAMFRYYPALAELTARCVEQYGRLTTPAQRNPVVPPMWRFQNSVSVSDEKLERLDERVEDAAKFAFARSRRYEMLEWPKPDDGDNVPEWLAEWNALDEDEKERFRQRAVNRLLEDRRMASETNESLEQSDDRLSAEREENCPPWAEPQVSQSTQ